jgi:hypothetical protein
MKNIINYIYDKYTNKKQFLYKYIEIDDSNIYIYKYIINENIYYSDKLKNNIKYKEIIINDCNIILIKELINILDNYTYLIYKNDFDIEPDISSNILKPPLLLRTDNFKGFKLLNLINDKNIYINDLIIIYNYINIINKFYINNNIIYDMEKIINENKDINEYIYYYIIALIYYIIYTYKPYEKKNFQKILSVNNINIPNLFRNDGYNHHKIINYFKNIIKEY